MCQGNDFISVILFTLTLWTQQLILPTGSTGLHHFDLETVCNGSIYMSDEHIQGFELVMSLVEPLVQLGNCNLLIEKRRDMEWLHFLFLKLEISDCRYASLDVFEGNDKETLTPVQDGFPTVSGHTTKCFLGRHYFSSQRFLILNFTWPNTARLRGTVLQFVANSLNCTDICSGFLRNCENDFCIHVDLKKSNYNLCGSDKNCVRPDRYTKSRTRPASKKNVRSSTTIVSSMFGFVIFALLVGVVCTILKQGMNRTSPYACLEEITDFIGWCLRGCCRGCSSVARACWDGLTEMTSAIWRAFRSAIASTDTEPDTTDNRSATSVTEETQANLVPTRRIYNTTRYRSVDTNDDDDSSNDSLIIYSVDDTNSEPEGAPPSYTVAIATPPAPCAPPAVGDITDIPQDPPPDYHMVMANTSIYNININC